MILRLWLCTALFLFAFTSLAEAAFITSKHKSDFSRLNFNWESAVAYDMKQEGALVKIRFKRSRPITKAQIDSHLKSESIVVHSFTNGKDFLEIIFETKKPAHALTLNKGGLVVLDFIFDAAPDPKKEATKNEFASDKTSQQQALKSLVDKVKSEKKAVPIKIEETVEGLRLVFDFGPDVKAGAFIEAGDLWVYFDQSVQFSWDSDAMNSSQFITDLASYKSNNLSAVKIDLSSEPEKASFYKKDAQWILETSNIQGVSPTYLTPQRDQGKIILSHLTLGQPIFAQMPETGQARYFIPTDTGTARLEKRYRYVDFALPPTILGIIVDPYSQGLVVEQDHEDLIITKNQGLLLSDERDIKSSRKRYQTPSLFNFEEWTEAGLDNPDNKETLLLDILNTPKNARTQKRLNLARHYLLVKRYNEASGVLGAALVMDPSLEKSPYYYSLKGLAAFATQHYDDAKKYFENPVLAGDPEMQMWAEFSKCRDFPGEVNHKALAAGAGFIEKYPDSFKSTAILFAVDALQVQNQDPAVFMDLLDKDNLNNRQKEHLEYLQAYKLAHSDKPHTALPFLNNYSKTMKSEFRIKSALLALELQQDSNTIKPEDEIKLLEKLRFHWTGDLNEYRLWNRLSDSYLKTKHYERSLKFLRKAIRNYPKSAVADRLQAKGEKIFQTALADKTTDLFVLIGLFQEFNMFMPKDEKRFKQQEQFIDMLVKADLIDQAMKAMEDVFKDTELKVGDKFKLENRYGLLALLNDDPEKTLAMLEATATQTLPEDVSVQRKYLKAHAHLMLEEFDQVRLLLVNDETPAAYELMVQSYMDQKDWPNLATYIQNHVNALKGSGKIIEPESIMRLATAYGLLGKTEDLKKLRINHAELMAQSPHKEAFEIITAENPTDFSSAGLLKELNRSKQMTKFLDDYREKVKKQGLSSL